jgi:hypothetical protein
MRFRTYLAQSVNSEILIALGAVYDDHTGKVEEFFRNFAQPQLKIMKKHRCSLLSLVGNGTFSQNTRITDHDKWAG